MDYSQEKVIAEIDFEQTKSELCSVVFFVGGIDFSNGTAKNRKLRFSVKSQGDIKKLSLEVHLKTRNPHKEIEITEEWTDYSIPLIEFNNKPTDWKEFKEVCFVVNRRNMTKGTLEIRNIKLI